MNCRIRDVALLLLALVLIAGLASAQPGLKITDSSGTQTTYTPSAVAAKAPTPGPSGTFKYWDGVASTDFLNTPQNVYAPPNPQIGVGPDDVLTIVNREIARYPNPNGLIASNAPATAASGFVTNPYNNPPTHKAFLDNWLGINLLNGLCPTTPRGQNTCVLDNASIRYDQLQGRFVVLFTITDIPAHTSNFVLIVSRWANFACSTTNSPASAACINNGFGQATGTSDLFTPPIVQVVGGPGTGNFNSNWVAYVVPVNVILPFTAPTGAGNSSTVTGKFCTTPNVGGSPLSLPTATTQGPITSGCTDYYPTGARFGIDNDNIILTAPVLDMSQISLVGTNAAGLPCAAGTAGCTVVIAPATQGSLTPGGPYAGTRVVTFPKLVAYNGTTINTTSQPTGSNGTGQGPTVTPGGDPTAVGLVNLADDTATGTLTGCITQTLNTFGGAGTLTNPTKCSAVPAIPGSLTNAIPPIFWEPDNLRGRALASFNSQISPAATQVNTAGIITPFDYLVGTLITDQFGAETANGSSNYYIQPVVFSCSGVAIYAAPSGVTFCGNGNGGTQLPDTSMLGPLKFGTGNPATIAGVSDPAPVGQGPGTSGLTNPPRLFVGDSRPQQVIFREGLLYVARAVRIFDGNANNPPGSSTVLYDVIRGGSAGSFSIIGANIPNLGLILETEWFNNPSSGDPGSGFYAPMYDTPANVIQTGSISPISLFPWLEKLFVGMTANDTINIAGTFPQNTNLPSLWDFRPGDDAYDTTQAYLDPYFGTVRLTVAIPGSTATSPMVPFGIRGGATTDPNDGSLWLYGAFARKRFSGIVGPGVWGTSVANYALDFPATDPYNNDNAFFADVQPGSQFFTWVQIAKNLGLANSKGTTTTNCPTAGTPILPPGTGTASGGIGTGTPLTCNLFGPNDTVTRAEMAYWVVRSQMDDAQVVAYLAATGGDPTGSAGCTASSFADVPACGGTFPTVPGATAKQLGQYIETMYRRGYTKGCSVTNDGRRRYCPNDNVLRGQMAVFIIRAKMNNVFPTSLSGIPLTAPYGDNFGTFLGVNPNANSFPPGTNTTSGAYFTDVPSTDDFFIYIQKLRELRVTNGTFIDPATGASTYSPTATLTRAQIATFMVRAFFL